MRQWRNSLTFRLIFLFTLVTSVLLIGLGSITLYLTDRHFLELDETYLKDKGMLISEISEHTPDPNHLENRIRSLLSSQTGLNVLLSIKGRVLYQSPGFLLPPGVEERFQSLAPESIIEWGAGKERMRGMSVNIAQSGHDSSMPAKLIVAIDTEHHDHFMSIFRSWLGLYLMISIVLGGLLSGFVARKALTPLRHISARASQITASQLDIRIPTQDAPAELASLAQSLNSMFERLGRDFERLSDFSTDLAHELRTPISSMLVQTQVTLSQPRQTDDYRETLHSLIEELERLSVMVSDMLYLAKTENSLETPTRMVVSLDEEVRQLIEFYELMADEKDISLEAEGHASILGDRLMVRRAISNLISNAIRHAHAGSTVRLSIDIDHAQTQLTVSNDGDTIPVDIQPRLFDRFYRGDAARSHPSLEGSGLGLAITKAIVEAHGGSIGVESDAGVTKFVLRFASV